MVFQIVSGMILTASYIPDFSSMEGNLSQKVVFGSTSLTPLLLTLLTATLAYFLSQKKFRISKK